MKHDPVRIDLDAYYASIPDTRPKRLWPVFGREGTVAWFDQYEKAASFVSGQLGKRNLYIGESKEAEL